MKQKIKRSLQLIYKKIYNWIYLFSRKQKIDKNKVIIVISRGQKLEGNLKLIYEEIKSMYPHFKIHFVIAENKMNLKLLKELLLIKDAKYVILDDYYLPVYLINPRKEVKIIQIWHAAGALKKFGYSTIGTAFGPNKNYLKIVPIHSNYTHAYVSAEYAKPYFAEAFNMSENKIHALGIPRAELFLSNNLGENLKAYESLDIKDIKKTFILWAPTYRAEGLHAESNIDMLAIMQYVMEYIPRDTIILYKPHPYSKINIEKLTKQVNFINASEESIDELLLIADALITDYSSVIFEYSLLKRPFVHYVPDLEEYTKNRGFYEQIKNVSDGVIIKDMEALITWIKKRKKNEYYETGKMVEHNFNNLTSSTKKIVNHFINEKE